MLSAVCVSAVQPVICQAFFIFFIKSQLLYALAVGEDETRRRALALVPNIPPFAEAGVGGGSVHRVCVPGCSHMYVSLGA